MMEKDRQLHNKSMLLQVYPTLRPVVSSVLCDLEKGFLPVITQAWRSTEQQARLYGSGHEGVLWSFHNAEQEGKPEALAVDVTTDGEHKKAFYLRLGAAARERGLLWGGVWRLTPREKDIVFAVMEARDWGADIRLGSDPEHIEVAGLTLEEAKRGVRPGEMVETKMRYRLTSRWVPPLHVKS